MSDHVTTTIATIRQHDRETLRKGWWTGAALALADEVDRLRELLGPEYHVLEVAADDHWHWALKHPIECRPNLLDCDVHAAIMGLHVPPGAPGLYRVELADDTLTYERLDEEAAR